MVPPETMMELAQTDRIIIGIHLFKKKTSSILLSQTVLSKTFFKCQN